MKVLFATAECVPFVKTGGLADVVGALPKTLIQKGVEVEVVLPFYSQIPDIYRSQVEHVLEFTIRMGWKHVYCGVKKLVHDSVTYYFIDNEDYFKREGLYGHWDDGERYAFFSMAVCEMLDRLRNVPNIIHVHDWHTAMIPVLLVHKYAWMEPLRNIRKILTIHNLKFQGVYDSIVIESLFGMGYDCFTDQGVKYYDKVNYLQGGIQYADSITTVSPQYAQEIKTFEFGETLDGVLRFNEWKLRGILNGIDTELYDPQTDPALFHNYSDKRLPGKYRHKEELQRLLGLDVNKDIPMIASISRLTDQKGFQLVAAELENIMQRNVQYVVLGTGDQHYENYFREVAGRYPHKMSARIEFDVSLAQQIYAASDFFLMPSAFEPCGLSQMIAMRYGSIPIVHETGGLKDTVAPYNKYEKTGTGFTFNGFSSDIMMHMIDEALAVYSSKTAYTKLVRHAMRLDFSWNQSADQYIELYESLLG